MKTTVLIVLEVDGAPADIFAAVDRFLDEGDLQNALNDAHVDIRVASALSTTPHQFIQSQRGK